MKTRLLKKIRKKYITRNAKYWKGKIEVLDKFTGNSLTLYPQDIINKIKKEFLNEYQIKRFNNIREKRRLKVIVRNFVKQK